MRGGGDGDRADDVGDRRSAIAGVARVISVDGDARRQGQPAGRDERSESPTFATCVRHLSPLSIRQTWTLELAVESMLAEASFHSSDYAAPRVEGHRAGRRLQRSR